MLYDEATGDYSMNQRHYVIDLCKKYLPLGGARVQTPTSVITGFRIYYKTAKMINAVP